MRDFRRIFASRLLRTGLLFLFLVGAPSVGGAYRCCSTGDHDGGHRASVRVSDVADAHATHALHGAGHATGHESKAPTEHQRSGAPCTCVGHCCAAPAIALGAQAARIPEAAQRSVEHVAIRDVALRLDSRDAHRLPFGNGPPFSLDS